MHLLYHELNPEPQNYSYIVDQRNFGKQLDLFQSREIMNGIEVKVTFDDGHASDYSIALPLLVERGMAAHFFITAGWIGERRGFMSWPELRELHDAGQQVGAHGWSHKLLTHCDRGELHVELVRARELLEDKLGTQITTISFPGGRFNGHVLAACAEAGYTKMFTSTPQVATLPDSDLIGRLNVRGDWDVTFMGSLLDPESKSLKKLQRQDKFKAMAKSVLGDFLYRRVWAIANRSTSSLMDAAE